MSARSKPQSSLFSSGRELTFVSSAALFTGAILNTLLVGVLIAQVASYLTHYRKTDKKGTLILVVPSLLALVMAAGACHLAFTYTKVGSSAFVVVKDGASQPLVYTLTSLRSQFVANPSSAMVAVGRARAYQSLAILTISEVWLLRRTHNVRRVSLLVRLSRRELTSHFAGDTKQPPHSHRWRVCSFCDWSNYLCSCYVK